MWQELTYDKNHELFRIMKKIRFVLYILLVVPLMNNCYYGGPAQIGFEQRMRMYASYDKYGSYDEPFWTESGQKLTIRYKLDSYSVIPSSYAKKLSKNDRYEIKRNFLVNNDDYNRHKKNRRKWTKEEIELIKKNGYPKGTIQFTGTEFIYH